MCEKANKVCQGFSKFRKTNGSQKFGKSTFYILYFKNKLRSRLGSY